MISISGQPQRHPPAPTLPGPQPYRGPKPVRASRPPAPSPVPQPDYVVIGTRGQRIPRAYFEQLRQRVMDRIDGLSGEIVSSKVLLGVKFWAAQKSPTIVGKAIAYMAEHGLLPIVRVYPFKSDTCAYYQLP